MKTRSDQTLVHDLRELIAALDRRVPRLEREGERDIAHDAKALKRAALNRIAELERSPSAAGERYRRTGDRMTGADQIRRFATLGNHLPRHCGIATFTTHLTDALVEAAARRGRIRPRDERRRPPPCVSLARPIRNRRRRPEPRIAARRIF